MRSVSALYRRRSSFSGSSLSFLLSRPASSPSHASHLPISLPPLIQPLIRQGGRTESGRVCGKLAAPLPPLGRKALRSPRRMEYIFQEKPPMFVKRFYFQAILRVWPCLFACLLLAAFGCLPRPSSGFPPSVPVVDRRRPSSLPCLFSDRLRQLLQGLFIAPSLPLLAEKPNKPRPQCATVKPHRGQIIACLA